MSVEAIGRVIRDLRRRNVEHPIDFPDPDLDMVDKAAIVDVTAIYDEWHASDKEWVLYDDSVLRPPLMNAVYAWENRWGNVIATSTVSIRRDENPDGLWDDIAWQPVEAEHTVDWEQVEWVTLVHFWLGGYSNTKNEHLPTRGPLVQVKLAISRDGQLLDATWRATQGLQVDNQGDLEERIAADLVVMTKAVTFLNCRNVQVLEPSRPRAERRRLERTGVRVSEIHVTPVGRSRASLGRAPIPLGRSGPLSSVRGHIARYGPAHGRGLLFGKYEGEYWIPEHLRGSEEHGRIDHEYELEAR